jgi:hypothetical protein
MKEIVHYFAHGYGVLCGVSQFLESTSDVQEVTCRNCLAHIGKQNRKGKITARAIRPNGGTSLCCICGESDHNNSMILGDDGRLYCAIHNPMER